MSLTEAEEKEWLSKVIRGSLGRDIHQLKVEDRPTWTKTDRVREFVAQIASDTLGTNGWPAILAAAKSPTSNLLDIYVWVWDEPRASEGRLIVSEPYALSAGEVDQSAELEAAFASEGEIVTPLHHLVVHEVPRVHKFDIGPAVIKALGEQRKREDSRP
jgi:hypothetical protein